MPKKNWILTDVDADIYQEQLSIGPDQVGGSARGYSVVKRTLHGGRREGVDVVEIDNGRLRFVVIPTRGMGICGPLRRRLAGLALVGPRPGQSGVRPVVGSHRPGLDQRFRRAAGPLRPGKRRARVPAQRRLRYPLHGKVANIPAHKVELAVDGDSGEIALPWAWSTRPGPSATSFA